MLVAKIERTEAVSHLDDILAASDGIMVARGDLAVEVGDAAVPALQKRMIKAAREANKFVITATQMMESMIESPVPTRAEVSDVANAVLDGTDAVMLSAESAAGKYPVETVETMARVCVEAEKSYEVTLDQQMFNRVFSRIDQSLAMSAIWTGHHLKVRAIASLTETGSTVLAMSRIDCGIPVYALTPNLNTLHKMTIYRGVRPILMMQDRQDRDSILLDAERKLIELGAIGIGDFMVITSGEPIGLSGSTNSLKIVRVGEQSQVASASKKAKR